MFTTIPSGIDTPFREPGDGPMEPFVVADRGDRPVDYYEDCIHCGACAMQYERHFGKFDPNDFAWLDRLAEALGCGEGCDSYEE